MQIWPIGGAREFELETPNLLWLMLRLSSICVANFITFSQAVLWAAIDFQSRRRRRYRYNEDITDRSLGAWTLITQIDTFHSFFTFHFNRISSKIFSSIVQGQFLPLYLEFVGHFFGCIFSQKPPLMSNHDMDWKPWQQNRGTDFTAAGKSIDILRGSSKNP